MTSAKLTKELQIYVVQQLALYEAPAAVRQQLTEEFGIEISLQAIQKYQITHPSFPAKWRELFETTRKEFVETVNNIPIAIKACRLRELQRMYEKTASAKIQNMRLMCQLLEQAAKESGDAFTNRREITGRDGGAVQIDQPAKVILYMPDDGRNPKPDELQAAQ